MPPVKFFARLDLDQNPSFLDGHYQRRDCGQWLRVGESKPMYRLPLQRWKKIESQARKLKLGIWSGFDLVPPWEFQERERN
jgi:hypothetical protein